MFEINESTILSAMLVLIVFIGLFGMLIWNEEALNLEYRWRGAKNMNNSFKNAINSNKNRNIKFVKIRADRVCNNCRSKIKSGTECLTVNNKKAGRVWYCMSCVDLLYQVTMVKMRKANVPFDDEGYWLALNDFEMELESNLK